MKIHGGVLDFTTLKMKSMKYHIKSNSSWYTNCGLFGKDLALCIEKNNQYLLQVNCGQQYAYVVLDKETVCKNCLRCRN